jgi:ADP-heptose:LPS heptosyltransferase
MHFKGQIPCKPHKINGYHCGNCPEYREVDKKILIIKLGAIGDVIRTTPLVKAYRKKFKNPKFTWITWTPDILPKNEIHEVLEFNAETVTYLQNTQFDIAINLDKEKEAGALLASVDANDKYGFILDKGEIAPVNFLAEHKFLTGLFDDLSKSNTLSYCQEIFDICDLKFDGETYLLDNHANLGYTWSQIDRSKKVIGLNTGCGDRWTTRLWEIEKWIELSNSLLSQGYEVILLGGKQEEERNKSISAESGAKYLGNFPLNQFINLMDQCDLIVTQVTMGMHIAIGLQKKIVLMNNIFNPNEFDLYNLGEIIEPPKKCECYYMGSCVNRTSCMHLLPSETIQNAIQRIL